MNTVRIGENESVYLVAYRYRGEGIYIEILDLERDRLLVSHTDIHESREVRGVFPYLFSAEEYLSEGGPAYWTIKDENDELVDSGLVIVGGYIQDLANRTDIPSTTDIATDVWGYER